MRRKGYGFWELPFPRTFILTNYSPHLMKRYPADLMSNCCSLTHSRIQQFFERCSKALPVRLQSLSTPTGQILRQQTPSFIRDYTAIFPMHVTDSRAIQMSALQSGFIPILQSAG